MLTELEYSSLNLFKEWHKKKIILHEFHPREHLQRNLLPYRSVKKKMGNWVFTYNVSVGTRMQFCMDLKLSKRNVQPLTIKRWIWAPIAIAQLGLNHFETKLEFPTLFSRSSMKWKVLCLWKLSAHSDVTLTPHDAFLRSFSRLQMILCCQCVIRIDLCPNLRVRPSLEVR